MGIKVIGLTFGPKAHEGAYYMHGDTCMSPSTLFYEMYSSLFLHGSSFYLNVIHPNEGVVTLKEPQEKKFLLLSILLLPSLTRFDLG